MGNKKGKFKYGRGYMTDYYVRPKHAIEWIQVNVTDRMIRVMWNPEMVADVQAFHNIDAEAELTALLEEQIGRWNGIHQDFLMTLTQE